MTEPINLRDYEQLAAAALPALVWDYFRSGACDELTLKRNERAFEALSLYYRVLVDVSRRSTACTLLGHALAAPVLIAPTAFQRLAHPDGELATARAAGEAGSIMVQSTLSTTPVEEVVAATRAPVWFQLYVYKDRDATRALIERVRAAGCKALVLTVDAPLLGRREPDMRNRFALPDTLVAANLHGDATRHVPARAAGSGLAAYFADLIDPSLQLADLAWLRDAAQLPIFVKGIVRADDALRVIDHGASGVIVSNHGGRQLDTAPATIEALPAIVDAVAGRAPILLDGGIRRGTDVIKALALGASAVLLGRPVLWGLAVAGQRGVEQVLGLLQREIDLALGLCGCPDLSHLTRDLVTQSKARD